MMTRRPGDTLVQWIALTIVLAMLISLGLNALFVQGAGVWAGPSLLKNGLLEQAAQTTRILESAPSAARPALARAATNPSFTVTWYPTRAATGLPPRADNMFKDGAPIIRRLLSDPARWVEAYEPHEWRQGGADQGYAMLIRLKDDSWLIFSTPVRSWGLNEGLHNAIIMALDLIATLAVAWFATLRLANPLRRFANAATHFGINFRAPPIPEEGPYELRTAIRAFNTMQRQIQHFVTDRTQMLAAISHDLRAPLTRMRLRGEFIDDAQQQRKLFRDVDEMQAMINAALEFFRENLGQEEPTSFDLAGLLLLIVDDYRDQDITVDFRGPRYYVFWGRPMGLKRVLTNLIDNAVSYAMPSADIQDKVCAGAVRIELCPAPDRVTINVSDHGPGIPDELLQQVFTPFFRVEGSRNRATGGVGLGLAVARAIIAEQGGELTLTNRAAGGLNAAIILPHQPA